MPIAITNLTGFPIVFRGNSGRTYYLPARASLEVLPDLETSNNRWVQRLVAHRVVSVRRVKRTLQHYLLRRHLSACAGVRTLKRRFPARHRMFHARDARLRRSTRRPFILAKKVPRLSRTR